MSYRPLARKWRPQRFDDVIGQQAVTRTLRNALKSGRIAQAFVFAGPRGCGKTTTARVLARALNCVNGPTPDPCGVCDACVEIAEGRDIDVLEIDAATHTGVDNVREVIIEGLSIAPVRNRYKVFIIDEVHMLSSSSFNALLKSIEEPPPHVVFMMATTELPKIPDTVLSRSQIYEFKTIPPKIVSERLRAIADAESIRIPDAAVMLLARAGEGSMRDSLSAFDQVRAFAGDEIAVDDVVTVLGLVGRDLVLDMLEAVAAEDPTRAFALVELALERGYDLRILCRELARATRDLLILSVDPARAADPDVAAADERDRLKHLSGLSSREDLIRAFDLLTRAEQEIRLSDHPRYNMEMTLLRLMHLRHLVPMAELLASGPTGAAGGSGAGRPGPAGAIGRFGPPAAPVPRAVPAAAVAPERPSAPKADRTAPVAPDRPSAAKADAPDSNAPVATGLPLRESFLAQIKASKSFFYNAVVAQAYAVDVSPERIQFTFLPNQRVPKQQCDDARGWLETLAERLTGKRVPVRVAVVETAPAGPVEPAAPALPMSSSPTRVSDDELRQAAMADPTVQALFEIFPVEKSRVEEM